MPRDQQVVCKKLLSDSKERVIYASVRQEEDVMSCIVLCVVLEVRNLQQEVPIEPSCITARSEVGA